MNTTYSPLASHADILLVRHAIFPGEERLRDEPKECLRGRLIVHEQNFFL